MSHEKTPPAAFMAAMRRERRGQVRIPADVRVLLRSLDDTVELHTDNVTRGGLFLKTATPTPMRELIQIAVDLGDNQALLETLAVVRHVLNATASRQSGLVAGMGVQFYGLAASDRQRWEAFVRRLAKERQVEGWDAEGGIDDELDFHPDVAATPLPAVAVVPAEPIAGPSTSRIRAPSPPPVVLPPAAGSFAASSRAGSNPCRTKFCGKPSATPDPAVTSASSAQAAPIAIRSSSRNASTTA
jgi:hypothetical protein